MKIGQRVSVTGKQGVKEFNDHRGIIVGQDTPIYCIEFDDFIHGHAGIGNKNKGGHCWWVPKNLITLIDWDFSKFNKEFMALLKELANCGWNVGYPIEEKDAWDYSDNTGKCKNFKAKEETDMKKWDFYVEEDGKRYGFNEFSILDIYEKKPRNCSEFDKEFMALLKELSNYGWEVGYLIDDSEEFSNFDTLICNIPWLLEKGFGEEVKEETELKPGMILRKVTTNADLLVTKDGMYTLSGWRNPGVWQSKYMKTLEEFNQYCGDNWEIVR